MTYEDYVKHAYALYQKGVDAEGAVRKNFFNQALNVLENVPDEYPAFERYPSKSDLVLRIRGML